MPAGSAARGISRPRGPRPGSPAGVGRLGRAQFVAQVTVTSLSILTAEGAEDLAEERRGVFLCEPLRKPLRPLRLSFAFRWFTQPLVESNAIC